VKGRSLPGPLRTGIVMVRVVCANPTSQMQSCQIARRIFLENEGGVLAGRQGHEDGQCVLKGRAPRRGRQRPAGQGARWKRGRGPVPGRAYFGTALSKGPSPGAGTCPLNIAPRAAQRWRCRLGSKCRHGVPTLWEASYAVGPTGPAPRGKDAEESRAKGACPSSPRRSDIGRSTRSCPSRPVMPPRLF
jgi:hypothetical protein